MIYNTCGLQASASGNTITINGTFYIDPNDTLTYGASGARLNLTLASTSKSEIDGVFNYDAGTTTRTFLLNGQLTIGVNGLITDFNGAAGGTFTMGASSTLIIGSPDGISKTGSTGAIQLPGPRNFSTTANYIFNGTGDQNTGDGLPSTIGSLTITNNSNTTLSLVTAVSGNITINPGSTLNGVLSSVGGVITGGGTNNTTFLATKTITTGTYTNLTLSGDTAYTVSGVVIVNGVLSIEDHATLTNAITTMGAASTIQYNTAYTRVTGFEWPSSFGGSGGVIITNAGTINLATNKTLTGGNLTINSAATLDLASYTINGPAGKTITISGTLAFSGANFPTSFGTKVFTGGTVAYTGTGQTVNAYTYNNLTLSGNGAVTLPAGMTSITGNFTLDGTASTATVVGLTIGGNLVIKDGTTFTAAGFALTVTGTTIVGEGVSGTLSISSATGAKLFSGLVTITANGTWDNSSANSAVSFAGGINNNGTFNAGTGVQTFQTNAQTLSGTLSIPTITITTITLTNNNTLTVGTALSGSGGLSQAANATLNIGGTSGITTLTATASGNLVNYSGAGQTVKTTTYNDLTFSGSATKTFAAANTINGKLSINSGVVANLGTFSSTSNTLTLAGIDQVSGTWGGTASAATNRNATYFANTTGILTVAANCVPGTWEGTTNTDWNTTSNWCGGVIPTSSTNVIITSVTNQPTISAAAVCNNITINSGAKLTIAGSNTLTVSGNWTNNGTFTANSSTVYFNGSSQTVGKGPYNNLSLTGSGTVNLQSSITSITGNLSLSGTVSTTTAGGLSITGNLTIGDGTLFTVGGYALTVTGTTTVGGGSSGSLVFSSSSGTKLFTGMVTIATNGTWDNSSGNSAVSFAGGITNNGTFTAGSGVQYFQTNAQGLSGTLLIPNLSVLTISLTNNNILTVTTALSGTGTLVQSTNSSLILTGTFTITTLNATALGNTVNYSGGNQTCKNTSYTNLTISSSGTKTTTGITVNGVLSMEGSATVSVAPAFGASATLQYNTSTARTAGVEWISPFVASGGIIITNTGVVTMNSNETINAPLMVNNGATLNLGTNVLSGTGSFTLNSGGGIIIGNASGITSSGAFGNIQVSGTRSFDMAGNYSYNGAATQVFGNGLPLTVSNLTINNGNGSMVLNGAQTVNGILTLTSGRLSIGANTLTLNGDFNGSSSNSLSANGSSSNLTISGSGTIGTLYFDQTISGTTNTFQNLTINRTGQTITLGNSLQITGTVTPTAGTLSSSGFMTLISNSSLTARVDVIQPSADIIGNVNVQTYIPAEVRRYRMLSSPVSGFTYTQLKNSIFFTGPGGVTNGFDFSTANSYTGFTYQESTSGSGRGWTGVGNITNSASAGTGLYIFVRGDRTLSSPAWYIPPFVAQNAVTLNYSGSLNKGSYSPTLTYTNTGVATDDGWNFVGNPYASQIDFLLLTKSNLASFYYIYNPSTGSYVTDNGSTPIASGQGFFVQATGASPSITFTESAKTSSTSTRYFKTNNPKISMQMIKDSVNSDIAWIEFVRGASADFDIKEDALKMYNSVINFGVTVNSDTIDLQYNTSPPLSLTSDTFKLFAYAASGTYKLSFDGFNSVDNSKQIQLIDSFTNTITDLRANPDYTFSITSNPASNGIGRFYLVITTSSSLPVKLLTFNAEKSSNDRDVNLNWSTASEQASDKFVIQRGLSKENLTDIGVVKAAGNSRKELGYIYLDKNILTEISSGTMYYRLKQIDKNGTNAFSNIVSVNVEKPSSKVSVYPNPATNVITINLLPLNSLIEIYDLTGKLMKKILTSEISEEIDISNFETGIYMMRIIFKEEEVPVTLKFTKE
ncbi:MAG: T9SS type A sorting domain-containing protein [Bacteroidia bacterium]